MLKSEELDSRLEIHQELAAQYTIGDQSPFSHANVLKGDDLENHKVQNAQVGLRTMPYPFSSAVSIVSDLDGTTKSRFYAYTEQLVDQFGLDFGDSYWLQWRSVKPTRDVRESRETGFFSCKFEYGNSEPAARYKHTLTFNEAVHQFHNGNLDHFHSLLPAGPRTLLLDEFTREKDTYYATIAPSRTGGGLRNANIYVTSVVVECSNPESILSINLVLFEGEDIYSENIGKTDNDRCCVNFWNDPENSADYAEMDNIERVEVQYRTSSSRVAPNHVFLLTAPTEVLIDRLQLLQEQYHVETGLVTDHASFHFRNQNSAILKDKRMRIEYDQHLPQSQSIHGSYYADDGERICTTDADDPDSLSRVFPEMTSTFGLRFVNPAGCTASSTTGYEPLNLVTPALTRAGTGVYVSRRTKPNVGKPLEGKKVDGIKSRQSTLAVRIKGILESASASTHLCWPLYTHIGALDAHINEHTSTTADGRKKSRSVQVYFSQDKDGNERNIPKPYFDSSPIKSLQNSVYNISGDLKAKDRVWFTRASVLYDYSLILRNIADHISRKNEDHIEISSWYDPVLDQKLPISESQLYGITLYVENSSKAFVTLDGKAIEMISRNPVDESGQESVTILATDIRQTFFEQLDPTDSSIDTAILSNATWEWSKSHDLAPSYGRLSLIGDSVETPGKGSMTISGLNVCSSGAQLCSFKLRTSDNTGAGVVLKTNTGGSFFFGSKKVMDSLSESMTASYLIEVSAENEWQTIVVPFHDLAWNSTSEEIIPIPSHSLQSMSLIGLANVDNTSANDATVDIADFCFHRPRATNCQSNVNTYCATGSVPDGGLNTIVHLRNEETNEKFSTNCDINGFFSFTNAKKSIYTIFASHNEKEYTTRFGKKIEISGNQTHTILDTEISRKEGIGV